MLIQRKILDRLKCHAISNYLVDKTELPMPFYNEVTDTLGGTIFYCVEKEVERVLPSK